MDNGEGRDMAAWARTVLGKKAGSEPGSSELYVRKGREMKRVT